MLNPTIWCWCGEGEEKQTLYNFNRYKFNKCFYSDIWLLCLILSYIYPSWDLMHLCDLIKIGARLTVKPGNYMTFIEVKTLIRPIDIPAFPAFVFRFLPDFSTAQSQLSVHCLMCFQHLLINSCHFLLETPAWVSNSPGIWDEFPREISASMLLTSELY